MTYISRSTLCRHRCYLGRRYHSHQNTFKRHNVATHAARTEETAIAGPSAFTVRYCVRVVVAIEVYPEFAEALVEFGITSMSVNPDAVGRTRRIVASAEQKIMLKRLRKLQPNHEDGFALGED